MSDSRCKPLHARCVDVTGWNFSNGSSLSWYDTYICVCVCVCVLCVCVLCVCECVCVCCVRVCVCMPPCLYTSPFIHAYKNTYIHTHTHTLFTITSPNTIYTHRLLHCPIQITGNFIKQAPDQPQIFPIYIKDILWGSTQT